ncbi:MAG TPA: GDSL-type esterase/lipase family protein [Membranihabitans sp.]|nr:GDSL-type esterase/lipase family protein [Membranihabitans sp.]
MYKNNIFSGLRFCRASWLTLFAFQLFCMAGVHGQNHSTDGSSPYTLDLPPSARIVFIGNSLMEEASQYGILEWLFVNAWPEKHLTFRNLGWSGDTADGKARSYISRPPEPYDLLIQQIDTLQPALVVVGYGGVESSMGKAGLDDFGASLQRLVDDIDSLGAQSLLLSTIPQFAPEGLSVDVSRVNANLSLYSGKIKELANLNGKPFVDLFPVFSELGKTYYTRNGLHLNGKGYYTMGKMILNSLGYSIPEWKLTIDVKNQEIKTSAGIEVVGQNLSRTDVDFKFQSRVQPVLVDDRNILPQKLIVKGLKKGVYGLSIDGENILAASSSDFAEGVTIEQGPSFDRARMVQHMFQEIKDLYFWEYRPLNRTYLVGFRRYEQGQNTYELGVNSLFINRLEDKIFQMNTREPQSFRLVRIN